MSHRCDRLRCQQAGAATLRGDGPGADKAVRLRLDRSGPPAQPCPGRVGGLGAVAVMVIVTVAVTELPLPSLAV